MLTSAALAGAFCVGFAIGMLMGVLMFWDRRFNEGRTYGYRQGCESRVDQEMIDRIRGAL
jgi:uncharacterized iron-regulated membrane protein